MSYLYAGRSQIIIPSNVRTLILRYGYCHKVVVHSLHFQSVRALINLLEAARKNMFSNYSRLLFTHKQPKIYQKLVLD
jgi:hypothetical protein